MDKVAIVILNWNGRKMMEQYLPSVIAHSQGATIYVADNASTDDSLEWLHIYNNKVKNAILFPKSFWVIAYVSHAVAPFRKE